MEETTNVGFVLSDKAYKFMKWLVLIVIPAFGTFYLALDKFVDVPNEEAVVGVCLVTATFLGTILGISGKNYNTSDARYAGHITVEESADGVKTYSLVVNGDPADIEWLPEATFKVTNSSG